jgi:hypothetical protein
MQFRDLDNNKQNKTVFIRKDGTLRAIQVPVTSFSYPTNQNPMFPIVKDRDEKSE